MTGQNKIIAAAVAGFLCAGVANAGIIPFNGIVTEDSNLDDIAIGEAQLHMQFSDFAAGVASFIFENTGPDNIYVAGVYFDGDILSSIDALIPSAGVAFSVGGNPADLPGGGDIGFMSDLHATADNPSSPNGIDPGESLEIHVSYAGSFADLLNAMNLGELMIGVNTRGIGPLGEGSESFVAKLPAPGALALLGIAGLIGRPRRRRA